MFGVFWQILDVLRAIKADTAKILLYLEPAPLTNKVVVQFKGEGYMANNVLVFNVGQTSQASIVPLLADGVTPSGGALSNVSYTFSDPSATVVLNPDGLTATCTGVAPSTGPVAGSAGCTVTDTDGAISTWTQSFTIQTNAAPPPTQLTQSVAVQFSAPAAPAPKGGVTAADVRSH